jgi:hypothetical protein
LKPNYRVTLKVEAPAGAYDVDTEMHVDYADAHRMKDGRTVDVYVDLKHPENRKQVVLCSEDDLSGTS